MSDPWDGILEAGMDILWQGRPDTSCAMTRDDLILFLFGLMFSGFAMLWMALAAQAGSYFWLFGLIHFSAGAALALFGALRDTVSRRYSYYAQTNRRAIIGLSYPWAARSLRKFRLTQPSKITADHVHRVFFGASGRYKRHPIPKRPPQFTRIDDAEKLYHLMQQIQKETP